MSDDLLERMGRALADEHDGSTATPGATRARILRRLHEQRIARRKRWAFGIPLLALFVGSTAWAGAAGRLPGPVQVWLDEAVLDRVSTSETAAVRTDAGRTDGGRTDGAAPAPAWKKESLPAGPEPADPEPALVDPEETREPPASNVQLPGEGAAGESRPAPEVARRVPDSGTSERPAAGQTPKSPLEAKDETLEMYKAAHRAHFHEQDWAGAERGYAAYLVQAPAGLFAAEARYNRGVCLIRLGRTTEARSVLEAFARGDFGGYRQKEARALIDAIE